MQFSDLIVKMANGEQLSSAEKDTLLMEARKMQETASLITSMVQPGTSTLKVDHFIANDAKITNAEILYAVTGDGDVVLDTQGITIKNNQQATLQFEDKNGQRGSLYIWSGLNNELNLTNNTGDGTIKFGVYNSTDGTTPFLQLKKDPANSSVFFIETGDSTQGARFSLNSKIELRTEHSGANSTFMRMLETVNTPPGGSNDAFHMYMKGDKLIIQFNAATTAHYFYLDLTATSNQSWIYSATAP